MAADDVLVTALFSLDNVLLKESDIFVLKVFEVVGVKSAKQLNSSAE